MKILFATDDSKFSEAAAKSLAQQFRPQDTEVRVSCRRTDYDLSTSADVPGHYPELEDRLRKHTRSQSGLPKRSLLLASGPRRDFFLKHENRIRSTATDSATEVIYPEVSHFEQTQRREVSYFQSGPWMARTKRVPVSTKSLAEHG